MSTAENLNFDHCDDPVGEHADKILSGVMTNKSEFIFFTKEDFMVAPTDEEEHERLYFGTLIAKRIIQNVMERNLPVHCEYDFDAQYIGLNYITFMKIRYVGNQQSGLES